MKKILLTIIILIISCNVYAANHYVRPPGQTYGSGNGSDWNNAYSDIPVTLVRGDTYYIAGGTYNSQKNFNTATSGTLYIYIKKANAVDNSGVSGWDNSFETTQAIFTGDLNYDRAWVFGSGYWDIDGVTGTGSNGSSYGFKVTYATTTPVQGQAKLIIGGYDYLSLKHIECANIGSSSDITQGCYSSGTSDSYITIKNSFMHDSGGFIEGNRPQTNNWTIEHNYFKDNWSSSAHHGAGIQMICGDNMTWRFNIFENANNGTAMFDMLGSHAGTPGITKCDASDWFIYGNIFLNDSGGGNGIIGTGNGNCGNGIINWYIYNNTFVNSSSKMFFFPLRDGTAGCLNDTPVITNAVIKNNLIYNGSGCVMTTTMGSTCYPDNAIVDYNYYNTAINIPSQTHIVNSTESTSVLFRNYAGSDYYLTGNSQAVDAGIALGSPYDIDFNGVIRPQGIGWDIGAYEFFLNTNHFNRKMKVKIGGVFQ